MHTPGEWFAERDRRDSTYRLVRTDEFIIARVHPLTFTTFDETALANSRLMAAAPDLLLALKACAEYFEHTDAPLGAIVREVIAKATAP